MVLKRSKPRANDAQLDLFSYTGGNNDHPDSIRNDGRRTLAEFCPRMVKGLETSGRLQEMLLEAEEKTEEELSTLRRQLMKQG